MCVAQEEEGSLKASFVAGDLRYKFDVCQQIT